MKKIFFTSYVSSMRLFTPQVSRQNTRLIQYQSQFKVTLCSHINSRLFSKEGTPAASVARVPYYPKSQTVKGEQKRGVGDFKAK